MLNITLTLTAAPELLAAISNIIGALTYEKIEKVKEEGADFKTNKIQMEQNHLQVPKVQNVPSQSFETVAVPVSSQAVKTEQYVQTVLPIDISRAAAKQGVGVSSGIEPQKQGQAAAFQYSAPVVPTAVQNYTMEQLAVAATQLVDAGRRTELVSLLSAFGVQALTALPKEQYGAFATQLRSLGVKI